MIDFSARGRIQPLYAVGWSAGAISKCREGRTGTGSAHTAAAPRATTRAPRANTASVHRCQSLRSSNHRRLSRVCATAPTVHAANPPRALAVFSNTAPSLSAVAPGWPDRTRRRRWHPRRWAEPAIQCACWWRSGLALRTRAHPGRRRPPRGVPRTRRRTAHARVRSADRASKTKSPFVPTRMPRRPATARVFCP